MQDDGLSAKRLCRNRARDLREPGHDRRGIGTRQIDDEPQLICAIFASQVNPAPPVSSEKSHFNELLADGVSLIDVDRVGIKQHTFAERQSCAGRHHFHELHSGVVQRDFERLTTQMDSAMPVVNNPY